MSVIGGKADEIVGKADISTLTKCAGAESRSSKCAMRFAAVTGVPREAPVAARLGRALG